MVYKKGSTGDDVKKIQQALNETGQYNLAVDGVYGNETAKAVTGYQQSNGLGVDGIVGSETWGKLFGGGTGTQNNAAQPTTQKTPMGTEYDPLKQTGTQADLAALEGGAPKYTESEAYQSAMQALTQHQSAKPEKYVSPYADRLEALYNEIMDRGEFKYDFNADPLYHQYKDQYMAGGKKAMQDTMAEAAALTGGYGNSYATTAGNLAYQQYLSGLNDVIPDLHSQAYNEWLNGGQKLIDQMALLQGLDDTAYARHRDNTGDYYTQLEYLSQQAGDQYNRDYGAYQDALNKWATDRDYYYGKDQDEQALAMAMASSSGGGSGGGGGSSKGGSTANPTSKDYNTILNTAKDMSKQNAYDYVNRMVAAGWITPDEGTKILTVEMGLDTSQYGGGTGDKGGNGNDYDLGTLREAIVQISKTQGMNAAAAEVDQMAKDFNLTYGMKQTLLDDAYRNRGAY